MSAEARDESNERPAFSSDTMICIIDDNQLTLYQQAASETPGFKVTEIAKAGDPFTFWSKDSEDPKSRNKIHNKLEEDKCAISIQKLQTSLDHAPFWTNLYLLRTTTKDSK